jgi:sarcosine oxidase
MSKENKTILYDAIVIGLGGVGSFALRSLSKGKIGRNKGNIGSSGSRFLGIERYTIGHDLGSSHGHTRLFRHAYFEHPNYVPLCIKSTKMFQELSNWRLNINLNNDNKIDKHNQKQKDEKLIPLLEHCGVLVLSDGGVNGQSYDIIDRCANSATKFNIPIKIMNSNELQNEYGNSFCITDQNNNKNNNSSLKGLLEPDAGFVRSELAIQYAIYDALYDHDHHDNKDSNENNENNNNGNKSNTDIIENVEVTNISSVGNSEDDNNSSTQKEIYLVETSDGCKYKTKGVIVTAGAWTSKLIPELNPYLKVTRQIQAWFELPTDKDDDSNNNNDNNTTTTTQPPSVGWFLDRDKDKLPLYGIPPDPLSNDRRVLSKIGLHGRDDVINPDDDRTQVTKEEIQEISDTIKDWIPEAANPQNIIETKACLYTMTPDEHFILDNVSNIRKVLLKKMTKGETQDDESSSSLSSSASNNNNKYNNIWCVAGLSGHGFKMTPALGEAVADLVMTEEEGDKEEGGEGGKTDLPIDFLRITKDRFRF